MAKFFLTYKDNVPGRRPDEEEANALAGIMADAINLAMTKHFHAVLSHCKRTDVPAADFAGLVMASLSAAVAMVGTHTGLFLADQVRNGLIEEPLPDAARRTALATSAVFALNLTTSINEKAKDDKALAALGAPIMPDVILMADRHDARYPWEDFKKWEDFVGLGDLADNLSEVTSG